MNRIHQGPGRANNPPRKLKLVEDSDEPMSRYPIKHRASRPGYDWPIRWEWERQ